MARRKKNAGKGFGMMFHGAFGSKQEARKKERKVHGFIQARNIRGERRFVVMSERKNPRKARRRNPKEYTLIREAGGHYNWWINDATADQLAIPYSGRQGHASNRRMAMAAIRASLNWTRTPKPGPGPRYGRPRNPSETAMRLMYFPVNAAWAFVYGTDLSTAVPTSMGDYGTFFPDRNQAVEAARLQGLHVAGNGDVSVAGAENPSELVVMGANPGHDIVLQPGKTYRIRSNPSAEAIRENFTGTPAEGYRVYDAPGMPAGEYAQLGELLSLYVKPLIGGQVREIRFTAPHPLLLTDTTARQLYFLNGDQDITEGLSLFNSVVQHAGRVELGELRRIDYKQRKEHVPDPDIDEWKHNFGEESGEKPRLWFDPQARRLYLEGGDYTVRPEGIVN